MTHLGLPPTAPGPGFHRARGRRGVPRRPERTVVGRIALAIVVAGLCAAVSLGGSAAAGQNEKLLALLGKMDSEYSRLEDYTAIFRKRERIGESTIYDERIFMKFQKPFKVYMKWLDESREALYVGGEYSDKVLVHYHGLFGMTTSAFSPDSALVMHNNRHPIFEIGFGFILEVLKKNFTLAEQYGEVEIIRMEDDVFDGRPSIVIEARFTPREGRKYYTSLMICQIDKEFMVPVSISCYNEKGEFQEQYSYVSVKINQNLGAMDFSRENKEYHFSR